MRNKFRESNQTAQWIKKQTIHFSNTRTLVSAFFKDNFTKISRFQKALLRNMLLLYSSVFQ